MRTLVLCWLVLPAHAAEIDLRTAVVHAPLTLGAAERKAVGMLLDEIEARTQIRLLTAGSSPADATPVIHIARRTPPGPPEGYRITIDAGARTQPTVLVEGNDARGVLFGIGHLLRTLRMDRQRLSLPSDFHADTAPKYPLRGHQLGYRPKTNSYDGWNLAMWEQYIRDLAVFGTNAIELIPPRSDDDADSPHFPLPPMDTMTGMSRLAADYGLDVWIWYPALDKDYSDPQTVEFALKEWAEVFRKLPRIDAVFVPGGDPGHTQPRHLMALLEKQTGSLRRYHPKAQMWVAPQGFSQEWLDEFLTLVRKEPAWLGGIVFGPQVRIGLAELRAAVPKRYPIRHYPDITHTIRSQYPAPGWDVAYALTEGREPVNPRPTQQARIFRLLQPHTIGFLTYSEGCNDDVNKIVWSALGWNPETPVIDILRDYARYFIGERFTDSFAQGLLALERDWRGPLAANEEVNGTLEQFRSMERAAAPRQLLSWRFQQGLYRAYYDAHLRSRLLRETAAEEEAMERLREARSAGSLAAMDRAAPALDRGFTEHPAADLRARVFELAEALFQSVRMQLSVTRYKAIGVGRGANLDSIDTPLNNRAWLKARFAALRSVADERERLRGIQEIVEWTNPGPGGFYDDLGNLARQPHLVGGPGFDEDPAFLKSALVGFAINPDGVAGPWRMSWMRHAESLNDEPLRMHYAGLDPFARYKIRIVYAGENLGHEIRLTADGAEVHPFRAKDRPVRPVEFDIPPAVTSDGELTLQWERKKGLGGNGRGVQVAEVWLMRQSEK